MIRRYDIIKKKGKKRKKNDNMKTIDLIKFTGNNEDIFTRVTATNLNKKAQLVVPEAYYAILFKDGQMLDTLSSGRYNIFDERQERKIESVEVEVLFFSATVKLQVGWGTNNQFILRDPETDIPVKVGARGSFEVQIKDPRKFYLELIGVEKNYDIVKLQDRLRERMLTKIEYDIANYMYENKITYDRVYSFKDPLSMVLKEKLSTMFDEDYGLTLYSFVIKDIFISDEDKEKIETQKKLDKEKWENTLKINKQKEEELMQDDKDWERMKFLLELKQNDYQKYLEVCKVIGWEPKNTSQFNYGMHCTNCGSRYEATDKFCPKCGRPVGESIKLCPKCGSKNKNTSMYCSSCGERL